MQKLRWCKIEGTHFNWCASYNNCKNSLEGGKEGEREMGVDSQRRKAARREGGGKGGGLDGRRQGQTKRGTDEVASEVTNVSAALCRKGHWFMRKTWQHTFLPLQSWQWLHLQQILGAAHVAYPLKFILCVSMRVSCFWQTFIYQLLWWDMVAPLLLEGSHQFGVSIVVSESTIVQ